MDVAPLTNPPSQRLAFLHTAQVHVANFERLVPAESADLSVDHVVDTTLLADAQALGVDDAGVIARVEAAMRKAAGRGARVVVCTCSTIGGIAERMDTGQAFTAMRIDRAMVDAAVRLGPKVLVVAALASTLGPTLRLLSDSADRIKVPLQPLPLHVPDAWAHFLAGDVQAYGESVASAVRAVPHEVDAVVLAQASMAPALALLQDWGVPVLASPVLGVRRALEHLDSLNPR